MGRIQKVRGAKWDSHQLSAFCMQSLAEINGCMMAGELRSIQTVTISIVKKPIHNEIQKQH